MKLSISIFGLLLSSTLANITPLNSNIADVSGGDTCPVSTTTWDILGSGTTSVQCIHYTCSNNLGRLITDIETEPITVDTAGKVWGEVVDINIALSDNNCGSNGQGSGTQECLIDECYHYGFLQTPSTYALPDADDGQNHLSSTTQSSGDYVNSADCKTVNTQDRKCYYVALFYFHGSIAANSYNHDAAIVRMNFAVTYQQVHGETTITAEVSNQQLSVKTVSASDVSADVADTESIITSGTSLSFVGGAPVSIVVGQALDLELQADTANQYRDFIQGSGVTAELPFTKNSNEYTIALDTSNLVFVNSGGAANAVRSIQFQVNANYLGIYTIRASAVLQNGVRLLQEVEVIDGVQSELQITVVQPTNQISLNYLAISLVVIVALVVQIYTSRNKKIRNEQQQYQSVDMEII